MNKLFFTLILMLVSFTASAQTSPRGDLNNDGIVSISDVMELVDIILHGDVPQVYTQCPDDHHPHLIDLGLPSGTLWACCNVGADKPEDYGDYFAWGEVTPKSEYNWGTYKWCNGSNSTLTKYCTHSDYGNDGFVDNKTVLEAEDDAAHANWGGGWRMPTKAEFEELLANTTYEWTTQNGVNGRKFTSTNKGSIFLPAGYRWNGELNGTGSRGDYWSSTLDESDPDGARYLRFDSAFVRTNDDSRGNGLSVRPVRQN